MKKLSLLMLLVLGAVVVPVGAAAGGGCHPTNRVPSAVDATGTKKVEVPIEKCEFRPTVLYVDPGAEVTWTNHDPMYHTVTGPLLTWGSTDDVLDGDQVSYRFDDEGVHPYACILHPGMNGAIVVGDGVGDLDAASVIGVAPVSDYDPPPPPPGDEGIDTSDALLLTGGLALVVGAAGFGAGWARRKGALR
jgi:plastocyanin